MPKRDPALMKRLGQVLRAKDVQGTNAVCRLFPSVDQGIAAARHLLQYEMPPDVYRWWLEEACDLPSDSLDEILLLLTRTAMEHERLGQAGP